MLGPLGVSVKKTVLCGEVETKIFGKSSKDGEQNNSSGDVLEPTASSENSTEEESDGGVAVDHTQKRSLDHVEQAPLTTSQAGRQRAKNREKVRQAARRGVVFGFAIDRNDATSSTARSPDAEFGKRMRVEAVQDGRVVEASFAKGEWGLRWRNGE